MRGRERELVVLRSENGTTWKEHTLEANEEAVQEVLNDSFEGEELRQIEDLRTSRIERILTLDFPQYFAIVSRLRQEIHPVGPEGGVISSTVVPQVQALFPPNALTKRIKVGLQVKIYNHYCFDIIDYYYYSLFRLNLFLLKWWQNYLATVLQYLLL